MSRQQDIESKLGGTRSDVVAAAKEIHRKMLDFNRLTDTDVQKQKLRFSSFVLRAMGICLQSSDVANARHTDLYLDIFIDSIISNACPMEAYSDDWSVFLSLLRYFYLALCSEKSVKQLNKVYQCISTKFQKLLRSDDYKHLLPIHMQHLSFHHKLEHSRSAKPNQTDADILQAKQELSQQRSLVMAGLSVLFNQMTIEIKQSNLSYPELIVDLNKYMFCKWSTSFLQLMAPLDSKSDNGLYESLYKLIAKNTFPDLEKLSEKYFAVVCMLLLIDINGLTKQKMLTAEYVKYLPIILEDHALRKCLYYYIALLGRGVGTADNDIAAKRASFQSKYIQISAQFISDLDKGSPIRIHSDVVAVMQQLLTKIHQYALGQYFDCFWKFFDGDAQVYAQHLKLIMALIKSAQATAESSIIQRCKNVACTQAYPHLIYSLGSCAMSAYNIYLQQKPKNQLCRDELRRTYARIMQYTIRTVGEMPCVLETSEATYMLRRLYITPPSRVTADVELLIQLAEMFVKLRNHAPPSEWLNLLRKLYKEAENFDLPNAAELRAIFIAHLDCPTNLENHIGAYFQKKTRTHCIADTLRTSNSPLKRQMTDNELCSLYDAEMQCVLHYFKSNIPLMRSLLDATTSSYKKVIIAGKLIASEVDIMTSVRENYELYRAKADAGRLTRLEQVTFAHACTLELMYRVEKQKIKLEMKDVKETLLEEMVISESLPLQMDVLGERELLDLAKCALRGFGEFWRNADKEPISANDALIDWELLLDNLVQISNQLQLMGYIAEATESWLLVVIISKTLGHRFKYLRAITFFFAHSELFLTPNKQINLEKEAKVAQVIISELLPQLHETHFYKRQHTFVLLCICQLANYYARRGYLRYAQILLIQASDVRDEFEERRNVVDIVQLHIESVRLRMLWQNEKCSTTLYMPTVLRLLDSVMTNTRNFTIISSADAIAYTQFIVEMALLATECTVNRFADCLNILYYALNASLSMKLALRTVQILTSWLWLDVQMENIDKAQFKLKLLRHFLGIEPLLSPDLKSAEADQQTRLAIKRAPENGAMKSYCGDLILQHLNMALVEPTRRQNTFNPSPIKKDVLTLSPNLKISKLLQYLEPSDTHLAGASDQLAWTHFSVGCLCARLFYLVNEYDQLDLFFSNAMEWLESHANSTIFNKRHKGLQLANAVYIVNFMRHKKKFEKAASICKLKLENDLLSCTQYVDINYSYNLSLQLKTIAIEANPKYSVTNFPNKSRRALKFNLSPDEVPNKARKAKDIEPKTSTKISRPKFTIYNESSPGELKSRIKRRIANTPIHSRKKPDHVFEKPSTTSLRKTKKTLAAGNQSKNSSPEDSTDGVDLNSCQVIDLDDLEDIVDLTGGEAEDKLTAKAGASKLVPSTPKPKSVAAKTVGRSTRKKTAKTEVNLNVSGHSNKDVAVADVVEKMNNLNIMTPSNSASPTRSARNLSATPGLVASITKTPATVTRAKRTAASAASTTAKKPGRPRRVVCENNENIDPAVTATTPIVGTRSRRIHRA